MADLFQRAKQLFPTASDDEINQGISQIKQQAPDASDDEILAQASKMKDHIESGAFDKHLQGESAVQNVAQNENVRNLLRQKLFGADGQYSEAARQKATQDAESQQKSLAPFEALAGLGGAISGRGANAYQDSFDKMRANIKDKTVGAFDRGKQQAIQDFTTDRQMTSADREDAQYKVDQDKQKRELDPTSPESQLAQTLAKKMIPSKDFSKMSAAQINGLLPSLTKVYDIEQKKLDRQEAREDRNDKREEARKDKLQRNQEQDIQKLSKDVAGTQDLANALDEVEGKLGFKVDDANTKDGKLMVNGEEKDLPGVSIPGIGRVSAYSQDARELQSSIGRVFNVTLKDRSGSAVTNNEMERLKSEFGAGKYNSEPEMVAALARYKRLLNQELKNREAAYGSDVVQKYTDQGGRTSKTIASSKTDSVNTSQSAPSDKVRVKDPNGKIRLIPKSQLKDALAAGGELAE